MTATFGPMLTAKLLVNVPDHVISQVQRNNSVKILKKPATRGITEATWTSSCKHKRSNGGDSGCAPLYPEGEERLLELFHIFPAMWLMPRGGGGKEPGFTKNIFLKMSLCNKEKAWLCDLTFFSEKVILKH